MHAPLSCALARLAAVVAATFVASVPALGDRVYQEKDGIVVVEVESAGPKGNWVQETKVDGYSGHGYLRWNGPDYFDEPGHDPIGFEFEIHNGGIYYFRVRNHHDHIDATEENDVWVRIDGGEWVKLFSGVKSYWTWASSHEFSAAFKPPAEYELTPGRHYLEFSGRAENFRMDRFHLYRPGHRHGQNPDAPVSLSLQENQAPVARIRVTPNSIEPDNSGGTIVVLDASNSFDPDGGHSLTYQWRVRGGTFVDGSSETSQVAKVRFSRTGYAIPVRLTVSDNHPDRALTARTHAVVNVSGSAAFVSGEPVAWHPIELAFHGPQTSEIASGPNPFLAYRLDVTFTGPSGQEYRVPGYYDGNGFGLGVGDVWKVRFAADEGGRWRWKASFRTGPDVALSLSPEAGAPLGFDGAEGEIGLFGRDPDAPGFLGKGRLDYVGGHYLRHGSGEYFLKGGCNSPENFLAYAGFDDVRDGGGLGLIHRYQAHENDWNAGDPFFVSDTASVTSKGIIGALNYLSEEGVNSLFFLPMNLGGDCRDTCPFVGYSKSDHDRTHYDISRLYQWSQVIDHSQRCGIQLQFVLAETETANQQWLDGGRFGPQRRLFFRELVARFGHSLGLKWNLSEENDFSPAQLDAMARYLRALDPYDHPIAVHTHPNNFRDYPGLLGNPNFDSTSIQYTPDRAEEFVEAWRAQSSANGHPWVIDMDENGPATSGVTDENAEEHRKRVLYDVYFSGGQLEWYLGYHALPLGGDMRIEDFRTRRDMWRFTRIAREFVQEYLPFWEMVPGDALLQGESSAFGGGEVFAKPGEVYVVYLPEASKGGRLDLSSAGGRYIARWFDPRTGRFEGERRMVRGGEVIQLGLPPTLPGEDWVFLVEALEHRPR